MKPYLLCLNINGMVHDGDKQGKLILTLAQGDQELAMLRVVEQSGWRGPVGILCHRDDADAELVLADNLDGLEWLNRSWPNRGPPGQTRAARAAPPVSYEVNGRQYIVIAATGGGKLGTPTGDAYVAFALPNTP